MKNLIIIFLIHTTILSCHSKLKPAGTSKDVNTGMVTSYSGLIPESSRVIMNDEVLSHTQIPLGESFVIINDKVSGLTVKDNKVSVGCSLQITDKNGKTILKNPDLFNGNDVFDKNSLDYLRCQVSTGDPMEWEETYTVKTVFFDKYGDGTIENSLPISLIDTP
jgi:hypothetical protein